MTGAAVGSNRRAIALRLLDLALRVFFEVKLMHFCYLLLKFKFLDFSLGMALQCNIVLVPVNYSGVSIS